MQRGGPVATLPVESLECPRMLERDFVATALRRRCDGPVMEGRLLERIGRDRKRLIEVVDRLTMEWSAIARSAAARNGDSRLRRQRVSLWSRRRR